MKTPITPRRVVCLASLLLLVGLVVRPSHGNEPSASERIFALDECQATLKKAALDRVGTEDAVCDEPYPEKGCLTQDVFEVAQALMCSYESPHGPPGPNIGVDYVQDRDKQRKDDDDSSSADSSVILGKGAMIGWLLVAFGVVACGCCRVRW